MGWPLLPALIYVMSVAWLDLQLHFEQYNFPVTIVTVLGTVIGLILAFRTNSAYARWWEARTLWGAIVNDSRTWTRQLLQFVGSQEDHADVVRRMGYRQIAWCYALCRSLREQTPTEDMHTLLDADEVNSYRIANNVPNALLLRQAEELRELYDANALELFAWVELERTLVRLTNSMGGCERIKKTVFPTSYSHMVHGLMFVFVALLPFGLANVPSIGLVFISMLLAFAFLLIDRVSIYLQDPFNDQPSDTPMLSLSRTIEINIKQMLEETELPKPMQPVDGVLM
ncbi:MAG: bestrophin family ion channel [Planctomycetota bacterium]